MSHYFNKQNLKLLALPCVSPFHQLILLQPRLILVGPSVLESRVTIENETRDASVAASRLDESQACSRSAPAEMFFRCGGEGIAELGF